MAINRRKTERNLTSISKSRGLYRLWKCSSVKIIRMVDPKKEHQSLRTNDSSPGLLRG